MPNLENCPQDAQIRDSSVRSQVRRVAAENGWDPNLIEALAMAESRGGLVTVSNPGSPGPGINPDGSQYSHGILQVGLGAARAAQEYMTGSFKLPFPVIEGTKGRFYAPELASLENSLLYGVNYLNSIKERYPAQTENGENWVVMMNAYNMGEGNVDKKAPHNHAKSVNDFYKCLTGRDIEGWPEGTPSLRVDRDPPPVLITFTPKCKSQPALPPGPPREKILPPNPNFPYCYVHVGGFSFGTGTIVKDGLFGKYPVTERPQYITEFQLVEKMLGRTEAIVRIFDPNWDVAGAAIRDQWRPDSWVNGEVEFGYLDREGFNLASTPLTEAEPTWSVGYKNFFVSGYHPEFFAWGVETTLHLMSIEASRDLESHSDVHDEPIATGRGEEGRQGIVEKLATRMGFDWCTLPTADMLEAGAGLDSARPAQKKRSQGGMGDMAFMIQKLAPEAVAADAIDPETGKPLQAQYKCWYTMDDNILHFHPPIVRNAPIRRIYTYTRARNGAIISFQPVIHDFRAAVLAGQGSKVSGTDDETREPIEAEETAETSPVLPAGLRRPPNKSTRQFLSALATRDHLAIEAVNDQHHAQALAAQWANLTIVGDPTVRPGWIIQVVVLNFVEDASGTPRSEQHWMTDTWQIREATHIIRGGQYLTSLRLFRSGLLAQAGEQGDLRSSELAVADANRDLNFDPAAGIAANFPTNLVRL